MCETLKCPWENYILSTHGLIRHGITPNIGVLPMACDFNKVQLTWSAERTWTNFLSEH